MRLDLFQCLEDVSPLIQEASSILPNWRGVAGFLHSAWECPHRVVKDRCGLRVSELLGPLEGCLPNRPSCGLLGLGEPRCE